MSQHGQPLRESRPKRQGLPPSPAARWVEWLAGGVVVVAVLAAYYNCFSVPFLFDDRDAVAENPTIRDLGAIGRVLSPPAGGLTVSGRPVVNLSLALNYALGGTTVWGYHAVNLGVHILASLTLLGIVRRTLLQPRLQERFGTGALPLGLAVALLWGLHPLQTESVTYVVQRAESLMGLFYLLTLYGFIRGVESAGRPRTTHHAPRTTPSSSIQGVASLGKGWYLVSVLACVLGMGSKEVMVTAPLLVWLYDRTFVAGTFRGALRARWRVYAGLGSSWLVLAYLVIHAGELGSERAGFQADVSWGSYGLTQFWAVVHYLRLSVWPAPLVFDYGTMLVTGARQVVPAALLVVGVVVGVVVSLVRWPGVGFVGCWFFAILAPTTSVLPLAGQTVAEHRMYLSLASVVAVFVLGIYTRLGWRSLGLFLALAVVSGWLTSRRNQDYRSELAIWSDAVAKHADNARARNNLGFALLQSGRVAEAIVHLERALQIKPDFADAHDNLGVALFRQDKVAEAIDQYEQALRFKPEHPRAHNNLGVALVQQGRVPEAINHYERALRVNPDVSEVHYNLGTALFQQGKAAEAIGHLEQRLRSQPEDAEAHYSLGTALLEQGRMPEAMEHLKQALRLQPAYAEAHMNLGIALFQSGGVTEAMGQFEEVLRLKPGDAEALNNLGAALMQQGKVSEARGHLEEAVRGKPEYANAHYNLGKALLREGRVREAVGHLETVLRLKPGDQEAANHLARVLATCGDGSVRDGARAIALAEGANQLAGGKDAVLLDTLAAGYAEAGRFEDAVRTARMAVELLQRAGQAEGARHIQERLQLYQAARPYHEGMGP